MEIIFYLLIGIILGAALVFFLLSGRNKRLRRELRGLQDAMTELRVAEQKAKTELELHKEQSRRETLLWREQAEKEALMRQEQSEKEALLRQEQFTEQLRVVKEQFSNLATKVLQQTSERLGKANTDSMEQLTRPIKDDFTKLEAMIRESNEKRTETAASLSERLKQMTEQTEKIDQTAQRLTNALRGDNKQAGDWGEQILSTLLDSQGFTEGIDYDVQETLLDEQGRAVLNEDSAQRMRPDVILHYPDNQDVIIDSKVSIKAYYDYVNEPNEQLKKMHLDRLVSAVRSQVRDLASKDYSKYLVNAQASTLNPQRPTLNHIDFVIMFVPNESALQLVLATDPKLWNDAFERKVFVTSTQNLFAILRMIQIAWRQHRQTENQQKILGMAEQLLSRIGLFVERVNTLDANIATLQKNFGEMRKSLDGRMGIVQKANEMKALGVKEDAKHKIPSVSSAE